MSTIQEAGETGALTGFQLGAIRRLKEEPAMRKALAVAILLAVPVLSLRGVAQEMTLKGEIVEVSCYTKLGVVKSSGEGHVACAKECVAKGQPLGILTDGDGLVKITGDFADNKYEKLVPYIGKQVEVRGVDARYLDYSRAIKIAKITPLPRK
jgi:hypothetical protein